MAPKCSQLTAIFVHLHMKACGMKGMRESGGQAQGSGREHGLHANGGNYKKSGLPNLSPNVLLKGSLTDS